MDCWPPFGLRFTVRVVEVDDPGGARAGDHVEHLDRTGERHRHVDEGVVEITPKPSATSAVPIRTRNDSASTFTVGWRSTSPRPAWPP